MASTRKPRAPRLSNEERSQKIKDLAIALATWREDLDDAQADAYAARFSGYSARNACLIAMQRPTATVVAGFHAWKDFGRKVSKGAKGIQILAPAGSKTVEGKPQADAATTTDPDKIRMFFRLTYVFDIADTEPISATESDAALTAALVAQSADGADELEDMFA